MVVALLDGRRTSMIRLGLRVVNLRCGGRRYHKGPRLAEAELRGIGCGRWLELRQALRVALVAWQVAGT